ncbi:MAG: hypothetical protein JWM78_215 [Verrucomicrobiaceae bacterium]|nr:hypothetical protein [Verrucomicrobiaceae bacterium]
MSTIVREAFNNQAKWCDKLGSPFTARVCRLIAENLRTDIPVAATILNWPGDPSAKADSLPLRVAGALHYVARNKKSSSLGNVYPPHAANDDSLWLSIRTALIECDEIIREYLAGPPQTNEVMRSAALLPGLLKIAAITGLPLALYEIGASAGLNLILDRYRYQFGAAKWGDSKSPVLIKPQWQGAAPLVETVLNIESREGVDINPIDLKNEAARLRLLSYVWADQTDRLQRLDAAISLWLRDPPTIECADAAQWLERAQFMQPRIGSTRVLFHSITWSYFPETTKQHIEKLLQASGAQASAEAPLAWLRFELAARATELKLTLWPHGEEILLASGHPHGSTIQWLV